MKKFLILSVLALNSCANLAQKEQSGLIIDPDFNHEFFQSYPYDFIEGKDSIYVDSVLVSTNVSEEKKIFSALILDSNNKHYSFNKCWSYLLNDTLVIEFLNNVIQDGDNLKIKVFDSRLFASLYAAETEKYYEGIPIFLTLKEQINKRGQVLFGELKIDFSKQSEKVDFVFQGPFTCVIGNN